MPDLLQDERFRSLPCGFSRLQAHFRRGCALEALERFRWAMQRVINAEPCWDCSRCDSKDMLLHATASQSAHFSCWRKHRSRLLGKLR